ncbi:hypothetical protein L3X38_011946 [Prunus dulcis]|uniref:Uncharacterized protein n=1 Tax=Prunus dulcis TaxID=3755 RepID=A0AAD4WIP7_PRUDU|nr:hypothetical protein L3X38_011946 [Prunus dulcis]
MKKMRKRKKKWKKRKKRKMKTMLGSKRQRLGMRMRKPMTTRPQPRPARFCFWELTEQLPRVVTHPGIAPASNSLNFGVPTNPKPVSSQKASHYFDARCAI